MIIINEELTSANGADLQPYQPQFLQRLIPPADERRECVSRLWIWLEGRQLKEGNLHVAKKGNFCLRPHPPPPPHRCTCSFIKVGQHCFSAYSVSFTGGGRPPQIALLFLTSRLCKSVISLIFSALRDTTSPPHPQPPPTPPTPLRHRQRRRAAFTSSPVSFLLALFVFCARRITTAALLRASRCFVFLAAVTLSLISLLSPSSFPLLLILAASCHACSCIISFDNLYTERRACACVCVCVRVCAFHENICLK